MIYFIEISKRSGTSPKFMKILYVLWKYKGIIHQNTESFKNRLADTEALIHSHDLCESDLLSAKDYADHIGGFNAAVASIQKTNPKKQRLQWH